MLLKSYERFMTNKSSLALRPSEALPMGSCKRIRRPAVAWPSIISYTTTVTSEVSLHLFTSQLFLVISSGKQSRNRFQIQRNERTRNAKVEPEEVNQKREPRNPRKQRPISDRFAATPPRSIPTEKGQRKGCPRVCRLLAANEHGKGRADMGGTLWYSRKKTVQRLREEPCVQFGDLESG